MAGRAISGSHSGTLKVWDLGSGQQQRTLIGHNGSIESVTVTPDGAAPCRWVSGH